MKGISFILIILFVVLLVAGCGRVEPVKSTPTEFVSDTGSRIVVKEASYFVDARGYNRDILILEDTETGKEYLAVMGAGVTEILVRCTGETCTTYEDP